MPFSLQLPTVVERLVRAVICRRTSPSQPIAIDEDNSAQDGTIIGARIAMGLREVRLQMRHLRIGQPEEIRHITAQFRAVEHIYPAQSMGPEP
ncbi:hypothetical protein, partial [Litorisediminicola beolgyonensis]